jgi:uncharacterized membrane protein
MNILTLLLFSANLYFALINAIRFTQTGSLTTLGVGLVNALACVLLTYGHFQREKLWKEWDEMVRKRMEDWDNIGT